MKLLDGKFWTVELDNEKYIVDSEADAIRKLKAMIKAGKKLKPNTPAIYAVRIPMKDDEKWKIESVNYQTIAEVLLSE